MAAPSVQHLSIESLERLLGKVPASTRAQLAPEPAELTAAFDEYQRRPQERFEADFAKACEQLDPLHRDLAAWAMEVWRAAARTDKSPPESLLCLHVLLVAVIEAVGHALPSDVIASVVEATHDEASRMLDALKRAKVKVEFFAGESEAQAGARHLRYLNHIQNTITEEEERELEANLR